MRNWFHAFRKFTAYCISKIYPPEKWYPIAYRLSGWMVFSRSRTDDSFTNTAGFNRAWKLNSLLAFLTRTGRPFPIPIRPYGTEILRKSRPNGLILCSTHLPLIKVAIRHLVTEQLQPDYAIAADLVATDSVAVWGVTEKIPAIRTGAHVLTKTKTLLKSGHTVMALVDKQLGATLSPNLFRLAHKLNADVAFVFAELEADGYVKVNFVEVSTADTCAAVAVNRQLATLHYHTNTILERYGNVGNPGMVLQPSFTA